MIKKSLLLTLLLAILAPWAAQAQDTETLTIGTGTNWSSVGSNGGQGYGSAFGNTYYYNSAAQFIYTADELEGVGTIHSVAFYHNAYSFNATVNIYLFHTTATIVDPSVPITEGTPVFSGTGITLGASDEGWQTFSFGDNAFEYNGTDNLLVVVCREKNGSGYSNYQKWQYTATDDNKFMVRSSDTNGYGLITNTSTYYPSTSRPNIQIAYEPVEQGDCPKPESLVASDVTAHSATLTWEGESSNGFILEWKKASESEWNSLTFSPYAHSYNVGGLDADTEYEARVQRSCGWDESSSEEILSDYRTVTFTTTVACFAPTNLTVEANAQTATFTWVSEVGSYQIAHATDATADPNDNIVGTATDTVYSMSDLTIDTDHYFWVRSNCGSEGYSAWAGPVSVHIGYCVPNPSSHDGNGITGVSFGTGDYVVTNGDGSASLPASAPYYGDYSSMIGAVQAGVESTIAITTATSGSYSDYPYTFVIWVDLDNSLSFEDSEILYIGKAPQGNGTFNATITVPATQALGDYRMRIYGADSYFTNFYNNGNTNWNADHDPCSTGSYRHAHDYTLRVLEAPSCMVPTGLAIVENSLTAHEVAFTWDNEEGATWQYYILSGSYNPTFVPTDVNFANHDLSTNEVSFDELPGDSDGTFWLRKKCSDTDFSDIISVDFHTLVSCLAPTNLAYTLTPGDGTKATFSWTDNSNATAWQLCINGDEDNPIDMDENPYTYDGFTPEQTYTAKVRAVCGGIDGESQWSSTVTFTPTNAYTLTVNDGTTTNGVVPIYGSWVDNYTRSQFIIPAEDLAAMQWGSINKMTFYAGADRSWGGAQFKVYLTETCETTLSALQDWNDMQEVYEGSLSIVGKKMEITFATPYQYNGGNLLVGFYQITTGSYSNCSWYGVTANGASMGGYGTSINQQNFLPKTTFDYVPGEEPACVPSSCLAASDVSAHNVTLNWSQNGSAEAWDVAYSTDGENFTTVEADTNVDYLLDNLAPTTEYTVKVSPTGCEAWSNIITFTTLEACPAPTGLAAANITYTTADLSWTSESDSYNIQYRTAAGMNVLWSDGFEDANTFSNWTRSSTNVIRNTSSKHTGSYGVQFTYTTNPPLYLISPDVSAYTSGSDLKLEFYYSNNSTTYTETFYVGFSSTDTEYDSFDFGTTEYSVTNKEWKHYFEDIPTGTKYFAIKYTGNDTYNMYVDDFVISSTIAAGTWQETTSNTTSKQLTGLTAGTEYEVQVQGVCDGTPGNWCPAISFTTLPFSITKTIEGYGNSDGGYYLIASPVIEDVTPSVENGFITNAFDLYYFDQTEHGAEWRNYEADEFSLTNGKGYLYASQETTTLTFVGTPYSGDSYEMPLVYDNDAIFKGWNLVGNPFTCMTYVDLSFYTLDDTGSEVIPVTDNTIEVMQGIFVVAEADGDSVTFTTTAPEPSAKLTLNLSQGRGIIDRAIVRFDESRQLPKIQLNPNHTKVYIPMDGKDYAVVNAEEMGEMPVSFKAETNGTYNLSFTTEEVSFNYLHLIDNMTGADVDLLETPSYTFEARSTDFANRFKLVFAMGTLSVSENFAFFSNGNLLINNEGEATVQVIDINGRILSSETINGSANINVNGAAGVYMIRLINGENVRVQKVVVR